MIENAIVQMTIFLSAWTKGNLAQVRHRDVYIGDGRRKEKDKMGVDREH